MPKYHYVPLDINSDTNLKDIAEKYNISISAASRWRQAIRSKDTRKLQRPFSVSSRILGILWAIGYDTGECFFLRCRYKEIIEEVRNFFRIDSRIISGQSRTGEQYKLKITGDTRQAILKTLNSHGWTPRNADVRKYPEGDIEHREFIQAWLQLHSCFDYRYFGKPRLRVYGNQYLITDMNDIISRLTGVTKKTPQRLHNGKTYALYYVSGNAETLNKYFGLGKENLYGKF